MSAPSEHEWLRYFKDNNKQQAAHQEKAMSLLDLPLDVCLLVVLVVPKASQLVLARTCRALRNVVCLSIPQGRLDSSLRMRKFLTLDTERVVYLSLLARDRVDDWVCEQCIAIHGACFKDTPAALTETSCPRGWEAGQERSFATLGRYLVKHSHVQVSIKLASNWDSLGVTRKSYLQCLLRPTRDWYMVSGNGRFAYTTVDFCATPKLVSVPTRPRNSAHWRFVVMTERRCTGPDHETHEPLGAPFRICRHSWCRPRALDQPTGYSVPPSIEPPTRIALNEAANSPGREVQFTCGGCPTDVSVQVQVNAGTRMRTITVRTWHDLGGYSTCMDGEWKAFEALDSHVRVASLYPKKDAVIVPGKSRMLYEQAWKTISFSELTQRNAADESGQSVASAS